MQLIIKWRKRTNKDRTFIDYTQVETDNKETRLELLRSYVDRRVRVVSITARERESAQ